MRLTRPLACRDHPLAFGGDGHRLFAQDVNARFGRAHGVFRVI